MMMMMMMMMMQTLCLHHHADIADILLSSMNSLCVYVLLFFVNCH